jgi:hypothetical protein
MGPDFGYGPFTEALHGLEKLPSKSLTTSSLPPFWPAKRIQPVGIDGVGAARQLSRWNSSQRSRRIGDPLSICRGRSGLPNLAMRYCWRSTPSDGISGLSFCGDAGTRTQLLLQDVWRAHWRLPM